MGTKQTAFKHRLGQPEARAIAKAVSRVEPAFSESMFLARALFGLEAQELKSRVFQMAIALRESLTGTRESALETLCNAFAPARQPGGTAPVTGFAAWPVIEAVGLIAPSEPSLFDQGMECLREVTELFSAEFAVREFLLADEARAMVHVRQWTKDPNHHIRRLASEGIRPRLPWGKQLGGFKADPSPVVAVLEALKDDPSAYVRTSVANNLNDIGKDNPEVLLSVAKRWKKDADAHRNWVIRHALRSLVKAGNTKALELLGYSAKAELNASGLRLSSKAISVGDTLSLSFQLDNNGNRSERVAIDYAVHHVKKNGSRSPKVFKLKTLTLAPGASAQIEKRHSFKPVMTRIYYPGMHAIEVFANGASLAQAEFNLVAAE